MIRPELWKGTCLACKEEVTFAGGFSCSKQPGNHRLASVRFYHMGGRDIQHPREKRSWAPLLMYARPKTRDSLTGNLNNPLPLEVQFNQGGILDADDAEVQFWLQTRSSAVGWGEPGRKAWEAVYLTTEQRATIAQNTLDSLNKQIEDKNSLLDETKARVGAARAKVGA